MLLNKYRLFLLKFVLIPTKILTTIKNKLKQIIG